MPDASKIDDGGAAFPFEYDDNSAPSGISYRLSHSGMTLRDYFAAAALTGLLASPNDSVYRYVIETAKTTSPAPMVAGLAYELADALIAASKTGGPEHG